MAMRTANDCTMVAAVRRSSVVVRGAQKPSHLPFAPAPRTWRFGSLCMVPTVIISPRGEERLRSGHPWIYRADVPDVRAQAGDIVQVRTARGRTLGSALFSDRSQITLRMLSHEDQVADEALVRRRIETAIAFRESLALDATAYR